jgi:putative glutamine amidotransferase
MPPLIGITTGLAAKGPLGAQVNASYLWAVQQAGGVPMLLPPHLSPEARDRLLGTFDGLLLTGGGDVDPARYSEAPHAETRGVSGERDTLEVAALRAALDREVPVLAICRGMQMLNVALGGSLHQHIPDACPASIVSHAMPEPREGPAHLVDVAGDSRLADIVAAAAIEVNSRHHQAVNRRGKGLHVVASAPDGVVEAMELTGYRAFLVGVQWHPEDMAGHFPSADRLFAAFVSAAAR